MVFREQVKVIEFEFPAFTGHKTEFFEFYLSRMKGVLTKDTPVRLKRLIVKPRSNTSILIVQQYPVDKKTHASSQQGLHQALYNNIKVSKIGYYYRHVFNVESHIFTSHFKSVNCIQIFLLWLKFY